MKNFKKTFWRYVYKFNGIVLFWIPGIIVANSKLYVDGDEYCTLRADGWVTVLHKRFPKSRDMLPVNMVSEYTIIKLAESTHTEEEMKVLEAEAIIKEK